MISDIQLENAVQLLRCPACRDNSAVLGPVRDGSFSLRCAECSVNYPVTNGIIDFLSGYEQNPQKGIAQRFMENGLVVSMYEKHFRPAFTRLGSPITYHEEIEWLRDINTDIQVKTVLDLACGTGKYSRLLNSIYQPELVFAVDISMPMLQKSREYAMANGMENVIHIRGDAAALPFKSGAIDRINCFGALHLFPDVPGTLGEISRVSKQKAVFTCLTSRKDKGLFGIGQSLFSRLFSFHFFDEELLKQDMGKVGLVNMQSVRKKMVLMFQCEKQAAD